MGSKEKDHDKGDIQPEGRYANYFKIGYNAFEFIIEFGQYYNDELPPQFHTRIIVSPDSAKALQSLMNKAIRTHRKRYS